MHGKGPRVNSENREKILFILQPNEMCPFAKCGRVCPAKRQRVRLHVATRHSFTSLIKIHVIRYAVIWNHVCSGSPNLHHIETYKPLSITSTFPRPVVDAKIVAEWVYDVVRTVLKWSGPIAIDTLVIVTAQAIFYPKDTLQTSTACVTIYDILAWQRVINFLECITKVDMHNRRNYGGQNDPLTCGDIQYNDWWSLFLSWYYDQASHLVQMGKRKLLELIVFRKETEWHYLFVGRLISD